MNFDRSYSHYLPLNYLPFALFELTINPPNMSTDKHEDKDKEFEIIVNTRKKKWAKKEISFREVVALAYPNPVFDENHSYTVVYSKGIDHKPKGTMVDGGENVKVKDGMVFDVEHADRS